MKIFQLAALVGTTTATWVEMAGPPRAAWDRGQTLVMHGNMNAQPSFAECQASCDRTPNCVYVHYCTHDAANIGRGGQCWGFDGVNTENTGAGCMVTRNANKLPATTTTTTTATTTTTTTTKAPRLPTDPDIVRTGDAPKCEVVNGHTVVAYSAAFHPSFKCTHGANACSCDVHPTSANSGCMQFDHTDGTTVSAGGDCVTQDVTYSWSKTAATCPTACDTAASNPADSYDCVGTDGSTGNAASACGTTPSTTTSCAATASCWETVIETTNNNGVWAYDGSAWSGDGGFNNGNGLMSTSYSTKAFTKMRITMNGVTNTFDLKPAYHGQTLKQLVHGNTKTNYLENTGWLNTLTNPWNMYRDGHEPYVCNEPSFNYKYYDGNNVGYSFARIGFSLSQEAPCGHPGTAEGVGLVETYHNDNLASGRLQWATENNHYYQAKVELY